MHSLKLAYFLQN